MGRRWKVGVLLVALVCCSCGKTPTPVISGTNWIQATAEAAFPAREYFTMLSYNDKLWVIGGTDGADTTYSDVWYSADGVTWTEATDSAAFGARSSHSSAVFDGRMWVIGGMDGDYEIRNDVWYSTDGVTWTQATASAEFPARYGHSSVSDGYRLWVIAGGGDVYAMNDVWYSTDGVTWTEATDAAAFPTRQGHSSVFFDNKLWVIGGINMPVDQYDMYSDVWYSSGGTEWTMATDDAFLGRQDMALVAAGDNMWMLGGFVVPHSRVNEVWRSGDGAAWTQVATTSDFTARCLLGGAYLNDRLWIAAGQPGAGALANDVWYAR